MEKKAPTEDAISKKFDSYKNYYAKLHEEQKDIDKYYELVYDAGVPSRYETRMPPTAREWIDVGVRHFTLDNPKSKVFLRADTDTARDQVANLETFYNFWLRKDIIPIKRAAKKLLKRGEGFLKINMDDTFFGSDSEERLFYFPLYLTNPDPINTFASPAHNGLVPGDVIESFNITVSEALAMSERNGWDWTSTKAPDKYVKWFSFISPQWRYFSIDEKPVLKPAVQPNILGFCNYVHFDAGQGDEHYEGKPEYQYRSLLWKQRDMLKMEVRTLSAMDAINARYAWTRLVVQGEDDDVKRIYPHGLPTDPDVVLREIKDRVEVRYLQGEQPPPGLFEEYALIQSQAGPPAVLAGRRPTGVYSGQHQEDLMASAKPIYKDAFKNLEDALGIGMGMGARIIEKVYKSDLEIKNFATDDSKQYRPIKPSDIAGHYDCEVQLLAEPPEATDMRKALGKGLRQGGSISHATELRDYHDMSEKEMEDEQAQMVAEVAMQQPAVLEVVAKNAMSRLGMKRELEMLEEAERLANQKIVKNIPPNRQGEGNVGQDLVRTQGRGTPGLESMPTPHEGEVGRGLAP